MDADEDKKLSGLNAQWVVCLCIIDSRLSNSGRSGTESGSDGTNFVLPPQGSGPDSTADGRPAAVQDRAEGAMPCNQVMPF